MTPVLLVLALLIAAVAIYGMERDMAETRRRR